MNFQEIYALSDWINSQKDVSWLNVTLEIKGTRSYPQPLLKNCVRDFLRRLDWAVFKNAALRYGKKLRRVPVPGGDPLAGIFHHYQLLLEAPKRMERANFEQLVRESWSKSIQGLKSKTRWAPRRIEGQVWMRPYLGGSDPFIRYLTRLEDPALERGINKVDVENAYLSPAHP